MEKPAGIFETLIQRFIAYGRTTWELTKFQFIGLVAGWLASVLSYFIVFFALATFMGLLNIGIALWLGEKMGAAYLGFLALAGFYLVVTLLLGIFMRKRFKNLIADFFIRKILSKTDGNES